MAQPAQEVSRPLPALRARPLPVALLAQADREGEEEPEEEAVAAEQREVGEAEEAARTSRFSLERTSRPPCRALWRHWALLEKGTCAYCHVEDRSSDEKKPKQVARRMVTMMRSINATFPDGQQHVTCYTCHRGSTTPLMVPELPGLGQ
jgi:hypothetical protein